METKFCTGCEKTKPIGEFPSDASKADGHHTRCKDCKRRTNTKTPPAPPESELDWRAKARRDAILALIRRHPYEYQELVGYHNRLNTPKATGGVWRDAHEALAG